MIDRALRDEGTSYHYLPRAEFSEADAAWSTRDARAARQPRAGLPRRELDHGRAVSRDRRRDRTCRARSILAVEMEAAALYAFARARYKPVLCLAHVTNQMAVADGDFEKGEAEGAYDSLAVIEAVARAWRAGGAG